jgi:hypothetical protein
MNMKNTKKLPWWAFYEPEWCEFAPKTTGLPVIVWIDVSGEKSRDDVPYIRFAPFAVPDGEENYNDLHGSRPMLIGKKPYVPRRKMKCLDKKLLPAMKDWVIKHEKLLKDVGTGKIDSYDFEVALGWRKPILK